MDERFLYDGPPAASLTILLGHGAGAPMDSASMSAAAGAFAGAGFRVARFEFAYMAARRTGGRKPPPRAENLKSEYIAAVDELSAVGALIVGGKSMGGRVASMVADDLFADGKIAGLLCLGYPLKTPALICQGTRDEFGARDEVTGYKLSDQIGILWLEDGDHDLKPRKTISGFSVADHLKTIASAAKNFAQRIAR